MNTYSASQNQPAFALDKQSIQILESISDGFVLLDSACRVVYMNTQAETILLRTRQELLGANFWDTFPGSVNSVFYARQQEAIETQQPVQFVEYAPLLHKWIEVRAYPAAEKLALYFLDVTQRIEAQKEQEEVEKELRVSEERLRIALKNSSITVYQQDKDLRYTWIYNPLPAFTPESVVGKMDADFVLPHEAAHLTDIKQRVLATGQGVVEEVKTTIDAGVSFAELTVEPLRDCTGAIVGVTGAAINITQRKHMEEALRQSEVKLNTLIDSNILGVFIADATGKFYDANDEFLRIIGYSREEVISGKVCWNKLTPPEQQEEEAKVVQSMIATGIGPAWEKDYIRKDGSRIPTIIGGAIFDKEKLLAIAFVLDISGRKELEERKDNFISIASHELKTPITSLKGYTHILKRKLDQQGFSEPVGMLARMDTQIDHLTRLVSDLLDVSKIQAGRLEYAQVSVDIDTLVCEVVESFQQTCSTHTIIIHGVSNNHVVGDGERLEQVLTNLLSNAIKYSPNADKVDIYITTVKGQVLISIQDYGVGIPQKHQDKIFERFYRAYNEGDKIFTGLGMGLNISYEIVKRHGGKISVESEEGIGSTFTVSLPLDS